MKVKVQCSSPACLQKLRNFLIQCLPYHWTEPGSSQKGTIDPKGYVVIIDLRETEVDRLKRDGYNIEVLDSFEREDPYKYVSKTNRFEHQLTSLIKERDVSKP